jgi:hypothetical protein
MLTSGRTLCRRRAKDIFRESRVQKSFPTWVQPSRRKRHHCTHSCNKDLSTAPRIIRSPAEKEPTFFCPGLCRQASGLIEMPGRGLEPLWISPPDPKSGASANFATPANFKAHERRFVAPFGQIALERLLRFLRQIRQCLRKTSPDPFSSRSLSALRDKAG